MSRLIIDNCAKNTRIASIQIDDFPEGNELSEDGQAGIEIELHASNRDIVDTVFIPEYELLYLYKYLQAHLKEIGKIK